MTDSTRRPRRICVVTGSRAEYGLLHQTMKRLDDNDQFTLQVVVTGAHLEPRFGETVREIEADGFAINARIPMALASDQPIDLAHGLGTAIGGMAEVFDDLQPDLVMVLGDRYEILAAVQAALLFGIPVGHVHGGEITEGAMDDCIRHAVTKMSHLHFVAADAYRDRVIQMGELPERVHTVGALALDNLSRHTATDRDAILADLGFTAADAYFLVTFHPATRGRLAPESAARELLTALDSFPDYKIIFTGINADPGRDAVAATIGAWADRRPERTKVVNSLGRQRYLAAMRHCAAVVGNSSSGLLEAPALGVPTVNVGDRQKGRIRAASVVDCGDDAAAIGGALRRALSAEFRVAYKSAPYPFGTAGAADRICATIASVDLDGLVNKGFYDLPGGRPT